MNGTGAGRFIFLASCSIHSPSGEVVEGIEFTPSVNSPVAYLGGPGVGSPSALVPAYKLPLSERLSPKITNSVKGACPNTGKEKTRRSGAESRKRAGSPSISPLYRAPHLTAGMEKDGFEEWQADHGGWVRGEGRQKRGRCPHGLRLGHLAVQAELR